MSNPEVKKKVQDIVERLERNPEAYVMGPLLQRIHRTQQENGVIEWYNLDQLYALLQFEAKRRWSGVRKPYCKDVHGRDCEICKSCHFCRQKRLDEKTTCAKCSITRRKGERAGSASGQWCGHCLDVRFGENIDEVRENPRWICPACRKICNCSAASCQRHAKGWEATAILCHEASQLNYKSVAHYLILTNLRMRFEKSPEQLQEFFASFKRDVVEEATPNADEGEVPSGARRARLRQGGRPKKPQQTAKERREQIFRDQEKELHELGEPLNDKSLETVLLLDPFAEDEHEVGDSHVPRTAGHEPTADGISGERAARTSGAGAAGRADGESRAARPGTRGQSASAEGGSRRTRRRMLGWTCTTNDFLDTKVAELFARLPARDLFSPYTDTAPNAPGAQVQQATTSGHATTAAAPIPPPTTVTPQSYPSAVPPPAAPSMNAGPQTAAVNATSHNALDNGPIPAAGPSGMAYPADNEASAAHQAGNHGDTGLHDNFRNVSRQSMAATFNQPGLNGFEPTGRAGESDGPTRGARGQEAGQNVYDGVGDDDGPHLGLLGSLSLPTQQAPRPPSVPTRPALGRDPNPVPAGARGVEDRFTSSRARAFQAGTSGPADSSLPFDQPVPPPADAPQIAQADLNSTASRLVSLALDTQTLPGPSMLTSAADVHIQDDGIFAELLKGARRVLSMSPEAELAAEGVTHPSEDQVDSMRQRLAVAVWKPHAKHMLRYFREYWSEGFGLSRYSETGKFGSGDHGLSEILPEQLSSPSQVKSAVACLLACAELLPHTDAVDRVQMILFNQEPFVDFAKCDPGVRSMLCKAAFGLLALAKAYDQYRKMQSVAARILGWLKLVMLEAKDLQETHVAFDTGTPIPHAQGFDVGPLTWLPNEYFCLERNKGRLDDLKNVIRLDKKLSSLICTLCLKALPHFGPDAVCFLSPELCRMLVHDTVGSVVQRPLAMLLAASLQHFLLHPPDQLNHVRAQRIPQIHATLQAHLLPYLKATLPQEMDIVEAYGKSCLRERGGIAKTMLACCYTFTIIQDEYWDEALDSVCMDQDCNMPFCDFWWRYEYKTGANQDKNGAVPVVMRILVSILQLTRSRPELFYQLGHKQRGAIAGLWIRGFLLDNGKDPAPGSTRKLMRALTREVIKLLLDVDEVPPTRNESKKWEVDKLREVMAKMDQFLQSSIARKQLIDMLIKHVKAHPAGPEQSHHYHYKLLLILEHVLPPSRHFPLFDCLKHMYDCVIVARDAVVDLTGDAKAAIEFLQQGLPRIVSILVKWQQETYSDPPRSSLTSDPRWLLNLLLKGMIQAQAFLLQQLHHLWSQGCRTSPECGELRRRSSVLLQQCLAALRVALELPGGGQAVLCRDLLHQHASDVMKITADWRPGASSTLAVMDWYQRHIFMQMLSRLMSNRNSNLIPCVHPHPSTPQQDALLKALNLVRNLLLDAVEIAGHYDADPAATAKAFLVLQPVLAFLHQLFKMYPGLVPPVKLAVEGSNDTLPASFLQYYSPDGSMTDRVKLAWGIANLLELALRCILAVSHNAQNLSRGQPAANNGGQPNGTVPQHAGACPGMAPQASAQQGPASVAAGQQANGETSASTHAAALVMTAGFVKPATEQILKACVWKLWSNIGRPKLPQNYKFYPAWKLPCPSPASVPLQTWEQADLRDKLLKDLSPQGLEENSNWQDWMKVVDVLSQNMGIRDV